MNQQNKMNNTNNNLIRLLPVKLITIAVSETAGYDRYEINERPNAATTQGQ
jgi:hypothetical protein